ncbi:hypothetical protein M8C21_033646 [Ambrosia artemisiifolia]|uniref:Uncharacterized protein n=1 Tax=Ambrosia artemisiifolia TaxID=4212 RepID=A0AAD5CQM2_AMBAR|nr:hypothetical protein M8C21_033646 [Ambrosia artemisiifolia]
MASFLQRLIRKQSLTKTLITDLNKQVPSSSTHLSKPKPDPPTLTTPFFTNLPKTTDESYLHPHSPTVYPSFSFEAFLNPIVSLPEDDVVSDS